MHSSIPGTQLTYVRGGENQAYIKRMWLGVKWRQGLFLNFVVVSLNNGLITLNAAPVGGRLVTLVWNIKVVMQRKLT